jgi:hypothetical protein
MIHKKGGISMSNRVIAGDFIGSKVGRCSLKNVKEISIFPERGHNIGEVSLFKDDERVVNYEVINQETKSAAGNALLGGVLFGAVGAIVGSSTGSGAIYTIAIEYNTGNHHVGLVKRKSLIEIDSELYKIFLASMF